MVDGVSLLVFGDRQFLCSYKDPSVKLPWYELYWISKNRLLAVYPALPGIYLMNYDECRAAMRPALGEFASSVQKNMDVMYNYMEDQNRLCKKTIFEFVDFEVSNKYFMMDKDTGKIENHALCFQYRVDEGQATDMETDKGVIWHIAEEGSKCIVKRKKIRKTHDDLCKRMKGLLAPSRQSNKTGHFNSHDGAGTQCGVNSSFNHHTAPQAGLGNTNFQDGTSSGVGQQQQNGFNCMGGHQAGFAEGFAPPVFNMGHSMGHQQQQGNGSMGEQHVGGINGDISGSSAAHGSSGAHHQTTGSCNNAYYTGHQQQPAQTSNGHHTGAQQARVDSRYSN